MKNTVKRGEKLEDQLWILQRNWSNIWAQLYFTKCFIFLGILYKKNANEIFIKIQQRKGYHQKNMVFQNEKKICFFKIGKTKWNLSFIWTGSERLQFNHFGTSDAADSDAENIDSKPELSSSISCHWKMHYKKNTKTLKKGFFYGIIST